MKNYILKILLLICVLNLTYSCSSDDASIIDGLPDAVVNDDPNDAPPRGLNETWNGHSKELYRQYFDNSVAVYYDDAVERPLEWPYQFLSNSWDYVTQTYGGYDDVNLLYAIFHAEGDEPFSASKFDEETSNRNIIDISLDGLEMSASNMDLLIQEMSNIVENSAFGVANSPASDLWGDKFAEIMLYDVYKTLEMEAEAQRIYDAALESSANYPTVDTYWFRDWFYPIYENYGGSTALNNFFRIASNTFPLDGNSYVRSMNMGEFVHFFSGATGEDLQPLAKEAFGWSEEWQEELIQARTSFPNLNYPFEPTSELIDFTTEAILTVSKDNGEGPEGAEGSLKLIDNDINTKFLVGGFSADFTLWLQQEFPEPQIVNKYTLTSGGDAPERDPTHWEFQASNDGVTWEVLDTRTDESFSERNQTREFSVENEEAYQYYRLFITENGGSDAVQISEWRLLNFEILGSQT